MSARYMPIPYGIANFRVLRRDGFYYVDKTRFVRELEKVRFAFFVRPRRFGKTLWLTMLDAYYDRAVADEFETVFAGTDIGDNPTANHSRYVVLYFDFSAIKQALPTLEAEFEGYCALHVEDAMRRNKDLFDEETRRRINALPSIQQKLEALFLYVRDHRIPLYVLIDEYDNFANTILSEQGAEAYHSFTHSGGFHGKDRSERQRATGCSLEGGRGWAKRRAARPGIGAFYRNFFGTLKAGAAQTGGIERLFVTGVSPVTMDDVTSGFNIATNISLRAQFNEMLGFSEREVRAMVEAYRRHDALAQDVDVALDTMREWYDGYRFSEGATQDVYNTDMVLYYLDESIATGKPPARLIDRNVRVDYGKLRHLLIVSRQQAEKERRSGAVELNGNFDLLREVVAEEGAECDLQDGFPLRELGKRENFLSLLHCFGLLSIRGDAEGRPRLGIPNQTVKRLMYGILRDAYDEAGVLSVDVYAFTDLVHEMAYRGAWRPVFERLAEAVSRHAGIRDHMNGEKMIQGFLAAYLAASSYFLLHSEWELGGGYADVCLEPNAVVHPGAPHGYVMELKYLKPSGNGEQVAALAEDAAGQLRRYLGDDALKRRRSDVRYTGLALVYHGWKLAHAEAVAVDG